MLNRVTLIGYVGSAPELRAFESGSRMARIRMATTEKVFQSKSQEWREHTEWHTIIFWGEVTSFIDKHIDKGTQLYVEGALRSREWTNKEGTKQQVVEIAGNVVKILGSPKGQPKQEQSPETPPPSPITPPKVDVDDIPF